MSYEGILIVDRQARQ